MTDNKSMDTSRLQSDTHEFSPSEIREQMDQILNSPEFNGTDAQTAFLQYVVEKKLAGRADEIKGYAVATEVFGRRDDFDQATDPIVSIQANKLRRALERYYLVAGQNDSIRVDIPKGTYVPTFRHQNETTGEETSLDDRLAGAYAGTIWPSLVVQPLVNLSGDPEFEHLGTAIASEIVLEIARYQEIHVYLQHPEKRKCRAADSGARFVLNGSVNKYPSRLKINVFLTDLSTGRQIWADAYSSEMNPAQMLQLGEEVPRAVAGKISAENGIIARQLSIETEGKPALQLSSYEAMLQYQKFNGNYTRQGFSDALEALRRASRNEPECGLVWSMLSRLYATNYGLELFESDTPIDKAVEFAQTGVKFEPANQRTRLTLAYALMIADEIQAAKAEAERALAMNPDSLIFLDNIGYLLTLLGDWQRGPALVRKAIDINPHYNVVVHHALWMDMFRRQDYQQAYLETLSFMTPNLFWDHLIKAATLGLLGRIRKGRLAAARLLELKPDFARRGNVLIGHFVKSDEVVEQLIAGLGRVGIDVVKE